MVAEAADVTREKSFHGVSFAPSTGVAGVACLFCAGVGRVCVGSGDQVGECVVGISVAVRVHVECVVLYDAARG
jgi:hypothetical protein